MDSSGVIEEVEALFKKLQDLPDNVRQKALSTIQGHLPTFTPSTENSDGTDVRPKLKRGRPRKRSPTSEQETPVKEPPGKVSINDWSDDDEIIVNAVQTSRGRNTKRISIASLMKPARRSSGYSSGMRKKSARKKLKVEEDSKMVPLIKMEMLDEDEINDGNYEDVQHAYYVESKAGKMKANDNEISADETEAYDNEAPAEDIENINTEESPNKNIAQEETHRNNQDETSPKEKSSLVKRGLSIQNRAHRMITTSGRAVYKCPECGKLFAQSSGLQLHLKRHRGERDFPCSECPYRAFTKIDLMRHTTIHTGERNHICQYCGKGYAKDSTLRDHVTAMHERKISHVCSVCGFATHRANNLRVHVRMRHHGEYNNHVCPVCQASIKQKSAFLEHMRSHTGERPYRCDQCPAAFACTARLNVHRNSVHGERQFQCERCQKCFQTKHHLLRHEAVHTKARPYSCPFCSYACNTQGNMAKHVRTIHNMPEYSFRKFKELQENGGQPRPLDPDWVEKGNKLTEQYLKELSEKLGRPITVEELWKRQEEMRIQKMTRVAKERASRGGNEHSYHSKVVRIKSTEMRTSGDPSEAEQLCDDPSAVEDHETGVEAAEGNQEDEEEEEEEEEERHPSYFNLIPNGGNLHLFMENEKFAIYTVDAPGEDRPEELEENAIRAYVNEHGDLVRLHVNTEDRPAGLEENTIEAYVNEHGQLVRFNANREDRPAGLEENAIQAYVTEHGQLVRLNANREDSSADLEENTIQTYVNVNEHGQYLKALKNISSSVSSVVVIGPDDAREAVSQPVYVLDDPSQLKVPSISSDAVHDASQDTDERIILVQKES